MRIRRSKACVAAAAAGLATLLLWGSAESRAQTAEPGQPIEITLRPAEGAYLRIDFDNSYKRTPWGEREVLRGTLPTHPPTSYSRETPDGMLYFDQNHDGKLSAAQMKFDGHVCAQGLRLNSVVGGVVVPYVVDLYTYPNANSGWLQVRSCWEGSLEAGGKSWSLRVVDPLNGVIDERAELTIAAVLQGGVQTPHDIAARVPRRLVLGEKCFDIGFEYQSDGGGTVLKARLKEVSLPTGEVAIQGQFIRKLLLRSGELLAVLDHPAPLIRVPVGDYSVERVALDAPPGFDGINLDLKVDPWSGLTAEGKETISVRENQQAVLKIGGPLQNTIAISRTGTSYAVAYTLKGAGGEEYLCLLRGRPVTLNTYVAGVKIGSATLPFG